MSARNSAALRRFMSRLLGWSDDRTVDLAIRSLKTAIDHRAAFVLCGEGDLVPIAHGLHRCALGDDRPFVVCDPRRDNRSASVRSPANRASGVAALEIAAGGSLCVRARRLPRDFAALAAQLRAIDDVLFMVCMKQDCTIPVLVRPVPVNVPPLTARAADLDRVIAEYAADAVAELGAPRGAFTADDHQWVRDHAAGSLAEVEKATLRLVALRTSRNTSAAATRLGMALVSLTRWLDRRTLPPMMISNQSEPCASIGPTAQLVGHLGDAIAAAPLGEQVVHGSAEILGRRDMLASSEAAPMLTSGAGGAR
jgi:hypothetical protein